MGLASTVRHHATATRLLLSVALVACSNEPPGETPSEVELRSSTSGLSSVDHVIVAIDTLERGIELMRRATGVTPALGGVHPGRGTQNALMNLGEDVYLELLAPNPADSAGPAMVAAFARYRQLAPVGWAARAVDADSLHASLTTMGLTGSDVRPGSRVRGDGSTLTWRTFAPWDIGTEWLLPFFIEWGDPAMHPAATAPAGCTLEGLTIMSPAADSLRPLLAAARLHVPVEQAAMRGLRLSLECPTGRRVFAAVSGTGAP